MDETTGQVDMNIQRDSLPAPPRQRVIPTHNRWRSLRLSGLVFGLLGLTLILGTVQVSQVMGVWSTSGKSISSGQKIMPKGENTEELKGWMTIQDVLTAYGLTKEEMYARFSIPDTVPVTAQLKEIEAQAPTFSVGALRSWLNER